MISPLWLFTRMLFFAMCTEVISYKEALYLHGTLKWLKTKISVCSTYGKKYQTNKLLPFGGFGWRVWGNSLRYTSKCSVSLNLHQNPTRKIEASSSLSFFWYSGIQCSHDHQWARQDMINIVHISRLWICMVLYFQELNL